MKKTSKRKKNYKKVLPAGGKVKSKNHVRGKQRFSLVVTRRGNGRLRL